MDETSDLYRDAVRQAHDLLRWRSPLRAELWASRLAAEWHDDEEAARAFVERAAHEDTPEARLVLAALASIGQPPAAEPATEETSTGPAEEGTNARDTSAGEPRADDETSAVEGAVSVETRVGETPSSDETRIGETTANMEERVGEATARVETRVGETPSSDETSVGEATANMEERVGKTTASEGPAVRWMRLMGQAHPEGAWYGTADPYGEQALAVISFVYPNGKEPHLAVVGIDQASGGFAVDAMIEEPKFLDDLDVRPADPVRVAGRVIDAFELTDAIMGAPVADTFPNARAIVLARARTAERSAAGAGEAGTGEAGTGEREARAGEARARAGEGAGVGGRPFEAEGAAGQGEDSSRGSESRRLSPDDTVERFDDLPDVPGASEAFATLVEFVGDRPSWWSPARVTQFITSWLPREAIMSEAAIDAMPQVLRAWTRHLGDHPELRARVEADSRDLPLLMADGLRFSLAKRLRLAEREHRGTDR
ncbi:hypothetical protein ACFSKW_30035 [Nonomuraea mangrovi]|uniref:Uncharacterized protein n=1 Tax=Nonomuraea mangrovi TaxID=2316207 RepID=A0ABW4T3B7_9ACTN